MADFDTLSIADMSVCDNLDQNRSMTLYDVETNSGTSSNSGGRDLDNTYIGGMYRKTGGSIPSTFAPDQEKKTWLPKKRNQLLVAVVALVVGCVGGYVLWYVLGACLECLGCKSPSSADFENDSTTSSYLPSVFSSSINGTRTSLLGGMSANELGEIITEDFHEMERQAAAARRQMCCLCCLCACCFGSTLVKVFFPGHCIKMKTKLGCGDEEEVSKEESEKEEEKKTTGTTVTEEAKTEDAAEETKTEEKLPEEKVSTEEEKSE